MGAFNIEGNIKQCYLPFVLNPEGNPINKTPEGSNVFKDLVGYKPQLFSFKTSTISSDSSAKLSICPSSYKDDESFDIANNMMRKYNLDKDNPNIKINLDDIMQHMPTITIREYQVDSKLTQMVNFFFEIMSLAQEKFSSAKKTGEANAKKEQESNSDASKFKEILTAIGEVATKIAKLSRYVFDIMCGSNFKYVDGKTDKNLYNVAISEDDIFSSKTVNYEQKSKDQILDFPFLLYYRLQSSLTTNIYEIPLLSNPNVANSNGQAGWGVDRIGYSSIQNGFVGNLIKAIPGVGGFINQALQNINIHFLKTWNGTEGMEVKEPQVTVEFNLYNDTTENSIYNFIFVNTIVPNNKYIQYGMMTHSPCLYDIKIGGFARLFCCVATFNVESKGVVRKPNKSFYDKLEKHINKNTYDGLLDSIKDNDLIRIPDVYTVKCTFDSIMPANFNNFLYNYSHNIDIKKNFIDTPSHGYVDSKFADSIDTILTSVATEVTGAFNDIFGESKSAEVKQ